VKFKVRAVTLAIPELNESFIELARKVKETEVRTEIWSYRIALAPTKCSLKLLDRASAFVEEADFDYFSVPLSAEGNLAEICESLSSYENLFASFNVPELELSRIPCLAEKYYQALNSLRKRGDYLTQCRIALVVKGPIETPYFPAAACVSGKPFLTGALLYAKYLYSKGNIIEKIRDAGRTCLKVLTEISCKAGIEVKGVDLSISPWMEESVVPLITSGKRSISLYRILVLNKAIERASAELKSCGFNEIMLPLAEDNELKRLAAEGALRARDFIRFSVACVAGVDMVLLPNAPREKFLEYIEECLAVAFIKNKPIGFRLIYTDAEPGEFIELGKFSSTPVIDF